MSSVVTTGSKERAPIVRRTLHAEVLDRVRDMIIEGDLAPGQRINEGAMGRQLGVSRTPLREAIKTLVSEGLVELVPAHGAVVHALSEVELAHVLQALSTLEQAAGRWACEHADAATIAAIAELHRKMTSLFKEQTRLEYFKLNQQIHSAIVKAGGNPVVSELHSTLQARIKRFRYVGNSETTKWAAAFAEHEEMMVALHNRDGAALAAALDQHLRHALLRVRYLFEAAS